MPLSPSHIYKSFLAAARGLVYVFKNEQNFRWQLVAGLGAGGLAFIFPLRSWEVILVFLLIISVLTMEILNTVVEKFMDLLKPRLDQYVEVIKDLMAGAVLLTALGALVIGLIIFLPYLVVLFK
ncbi:MAG: diacylglycerol kinase family protein [Candidatus Magasanikbacteria bacterium]|nr:diacylglycerol kinase family protein [Candidatus Magasanikbacteria bacterium]